MRTSADDFPYIDLHKFTAGFCGDSCGREGFFKASDPAGLYFTELRVAFVSANGACVTSQSLARLGEKDRSAEFGG